MRAERAISSVVVPMTGSIPLLSGGYFVLCPASSCTNFTSLPCANAAWLLQDGIELEFTVILEFENDLLYF